MSFVTLFIPADNIISAPLLHKTVSLEYGPIITHVSKASLPSVTTDGPPVPGKIIKLNFYCFVFFNETYLLGILKIEMCNKGLCENLYMEKTNNGIFPL